MEIRGKAHCLFEQSGTFKKEFIKLGIPAEDYDIQNNFGETNHVIDLFAEIENAYDGGVSIFDNMTKDDIIMAFFPCIYFECLSMMAFSWGCKNYKKLTYKQKSDAILERAKNREKFYSLLVKMVTIAQIRKLRLIVENPYSMQHYLKQGNFVKGPSLIDNNRMMRGDYFIKPTAYWFFNCNPTHLLTIQRDKQQKRVSYAKKSKQAGLCSEERSMISPDYARNFICDFIIGKPQVLTQMSLFDMPM